jgi:hypothetical protein
LTIKGRPKDQSANHNPGPGYYENDNSPVKDRVVSYDMGKSGNKKSYNEPNSREQSPGPGYYDSNHK